MSLDGAGPSIRQRRIFQHAPALRLVGTGRGINGADPRCVTERRTGSRGPDVPPDQRVLGGDVGLPIQVTPACT